MYLRRPNYFTDIIVNNRHYHVASFHLLMSLLNYFDTYLGLWN